MNKEPIDTDMYEQALDITEAGYGITEEQVNALQHDDSLSENVQMALDMRTEMQLRKNPIDVEERLQKFYKDRIIPRKAHYEDNESSNRSRTLIISLLAVAATVVGFIFFINYKELVNTDPGSVFVADAINTGISITNEDGEEIVVSNKKKQNISISLNDLKQVINNGETEKIILSIPFGSSGDIQLPDSSIVYMHPGSKLIFPTRFTGDNREVFFTGEAYFKIHHDASHPFIVKSERMETKVLGTEFNINTVSNKTTLIRGKILVKDTDNDKEIIVKPGHQVDIEKGMIVSKVNTEPYEFWRDGYLYFDQVELIDIMKAIGENFNMSVVFHNQQALHYKMRFITERNKGVKAAIEAMNAMNKVTVSQVGNKLIVD